MSTEGFKRKLSAVLSADVAGYSRLMGEDDSATVRTLTGHREMMSTLIRQHQRRVIDYPGDNLLAEGHVAIGVVKLAYEYDWKGAKEFLNRSIELNPGLWQANHFYAYYHFAMGQLDEAITMLKHALELDSLSALINRAVDFVNNTLWGTLNATLITMIISYSQ